MAKTFTLGQLKNKRYDELPLSEDWTKHIGIPTTNFTMSVTGASGNGKTSYILKLVKELVQSGRLLYVGKEEGDAKTFHDACERIGLWNINPKKFKGVIDCSYEDVITELKESRVKFKFLVIDSLDALGLTYQQFLKLRDTYPSMGIIVISWSHNGEPKSQYAKAIHYMCNIKVLVENYIAVARTRYNGGGEDFIIWKEGAEKFRIKPIRFKTDGGIQKGLFS